MTPQTLLIGHLYVRDQQSLIESIYQANQAFLRNPHLAGLTPAECHLNPSEVETLPDHIQVLIGNEGAVRLPIIPDKTVQPGQVLICCPDPEAEKEEAAL